MIKAWFARFILPLLTMGVTLPLWLIFAAALWLHLDRDSAVRQAVDRATAELVAGHELEAARATAAAERELRRYFQRSAEAERRRADQLETANSNHAAALALAEEQKELLAHDLDEILSRPVDDRCHVDGDLLDRLRNR